jgi:glycosyltransferase involved in cell wall biosynthesis
MKLSIIVPAYNEEKTISDVLNNVKKIRLPDGVDKEIIVIDDGSTDDTYKILQKIDEIVVTRNKKNSGKGFAARKGISLSTGDVIVFQDADMEYHPEQIPMLLKEVLEGEDIVYGSRFIGKIDGMSFSHLVGNRIISLATSILYGQNLTDTETCYKMFRKDTLKDIKLVTNRFGLEPEITAKFLKRGFNIKEIPINYRGRSKSEKKINWKDGMLAVWYIIKFRVAD